ncbi:symplekin [Octopus sinensis]|uniref:Symplekin n=1 Tax=Octopus sinensis TaxID=2607531 RepID=A0A6P7SIE9_9MOLL|nr:symplekin [Octopus sinensis]
MVEQTGETTGVTDSAAAPPSISRCNGAYPIVDHVIQILPIDIVFTVFVILLYIFMNITMAGDNRRSTAAQFFSEEEDAGTEQMSTYNRVVDLLNQASFMQKNNMKTENLRQVQELILYKEPNLLDNFLEEMLAFQSDRSVEVRKFVISFIEDACKKEPDLLQKILPNLGALFQDENVNVQKRVILAMAGLHRLALQWLSQSKTITEEMQQTWKQILQLKTFIIEMMESLNDGIRTHVVKFIENVVLTLTKKSPESDIPKKLENEMTLDKVPENHKLLDVNKLEEEGNELFVSLLKFQASPHISSINLMTVMGSLTAIAKQRPVYFDQVVQAFESLHVNLPPTLAKSQVSSVRKNLKMQMLALLKHPYSPRFMSQITTLLTDLGAMQSEVMKCMPKTEDIKKRKAEDGPSTSSSKKSKVEIKPDPDVEEEEIGAPPSKEKLPSTAQKQTAIDITAEDLVGRLNPHNVADLVLISMVMLPDTLPAHFQATYTPIAAAGTPGQIKHLARLLATQLTMAGMGKGISDVQRMNVESEETPATTEEEKVTTKLQIQTVVGGTIQVGADEPKKPDTALITTQPLMGTRKGSKQFKLSSVTKPMNRDLLDQMTVRAVRRILMAEKSALIGNALPERTKILASLVAQFGGELKNLLQEYIFEDLRNRADIAFSWLYQEYVVCHGFNRSNMGEHKTVLASYDECLTRLLNGLLERSDHRDGLFTRLFLEAPVITDNAIQILRKFCQDENRVHIGMETLQEMILARPHHRPKYLILLLDFASHDKVEVRNHAIHVIKKLYERDDIHKLIEAHALTYLRYLLSPKPPPELFSATKLKSDPPETWVEDCIKLCLYLYLGLLPSNHKLIHELATVYTATSADIKRTILRVLENPVRGMGMDSPELLLLVENCPKGAETLVTRVIHILTDKSVPSPELVERVRDLYHKRVPDVRFLIPVLTGLRKKEVLAALPKLIRLNPIVVKEVFNRLLGHANADASYTSPLTPAELLIALHNIDPTKCDMKTIIKATNLCFSEKNVYTQEVLAVVMQQLMELNPLPTLLMRTVLQSLSMYPRLIGFVMNILQRLITKQVWKQKRVWEGFIRCCQRTKTQSFQVLLQLPAPQLRNVFEISPDLREPLFHHVQSFTPHQRAHIPKVIMNVLEKDPLEQVKAAEKLEKEKRENSVVIKVPTVEGTDTAIPNQPTESTAPESQPKATEDKPNDDESQNLPLPSAVVPVPLLTQPSSLPSQQFPKTQTASEVPQEIETLSTPAVVHEKEVEDDDKDQTAQPGANDNTVPPSHCSNSPSPYPTLLTLTEGSTD